MIWVAICLSLLFAYCAFLTVIVLGQAQLINRLDKDQRTLMNFIAELCTPGNFSVAYVPKKSEARKPPGNAN